MRKVPLRRRLLVLAAATILPLAVMSGIGLLVLIKQQREQTERAALEISRALATAVDAELRRSLSVLEALATTTPLDRVNAEAFYQRAQRALVTQTHWLALILAEPDAQVLLNTRLPFGSKPPPIAEKESFERVVQTRKPVVGALARGEREWGVPMRVPVVREDGLRFVLTGVVKPQVILEVINRQKVPNDWVVSVFDAKGLRVARSRGHEEFIGTRGSPSLQKLMATGAEEAIGLTDTLEGDLIHTAYTRLKDSGWTVAIGIPAATLEAGVVRAFAAYGGGILLSLILGALAALGVARSINRPMSELRKAAQSLGHGEPPALPVSDIREIQEVADALAASAEQRARSDAERADLLAAERAVRTSAEDARRRLELLASAGAALSRSLEPQATLQAIAATVVPGIADWCRVDLLDADGELQRALTHHFDPDKTRYGTELAERLHAAPGAVGSMAWVVATGQSHLAHFEPVQEFDRIRDRDLLTFASAIGMRAYFIVPLIARGRTLGALAALQAESGRGLSEDDCALITELAQRAALALDNARLYANAEAALQQAETANRAKSDFLSSMSHELRTPLGAILGFAQLIESGSPSPTSSQKRSVDQILKAGWYLLDLINEILDLALIESGKLPLSLEPMSLTDVVRECHAMIEPQAQKRGIRMTFPQLAMPYFVEADRTRVKQVLINLLSNAVKYNKTGGAIVVECVASTPGRIRICVKDSGEGLTADKMAQLFQPFNRLGREAGVEEGTGIGLMVSKRLVELMKGGIGVESTVGVGSVFWIELNLTAEPRPVAAAAEPTALAQVQFQADGRLRTLLYVEDNPANLMLVEDLIARRPDIRLLSAMDGIRGVEIARASRPDVILMDINLPGISGIQALKILQADPTTAQIPVVALSANAMPHDIERGLETGFFRYLTKPIKVNEFMEALDVALEYAKTRVGQGK